MNFFTELIQNRILIAVLITMIETQIIKGFLAALINHRFEIKRFFGDGGMPSAHAAVVASLCTACAYYCGANSEAFAISIVVGMIVCRDASGVRLETGKQAAAINDLNEIIEVLTSQDLPDVKLRELVGHTPVQVLVGLLNGIAVTLVLCMLL